MQPQQQRSRFTPPSSPKQEDYTRRPTKSTTNSNNNTLKRDAQQQQQQQQQNRRYSAAGTPPALPNKPSAYSSYRGGGGGAYDYQQQQPSFMEDPTFLHAESRKRRFDDLPNMNANDSYYHEDNMAELSRTLEEMNMQVDDMREQVSQFAVDKHAYFEEQSKLYDEDGNPILQYDEFGNLVDAAMLANKQHEHEAANQLVKIEIPLLQITQGWLWKKGKGLLSFNRTWKRRFFQIDLERIRPIYFFKEEQRAMQGIQPDESGESFRARKAAYWAHQRQRASGTFFLGNEYELASTKLLAEEELDKEHQNPNIIRELVFNLYIPGEGWQMLCAETEEEYNQWINTINYIVNVMARNRVIVANRKNGVANQAGNGNSGRLGGGGDTVEEMEAKRDLALTAVHAFGKGLFEASAGYPSEFFVQVTDTMSGPEIYAEMISAVLESRELHYDLQVSPFGNEHGLFRVTYTPTRPGRYELSVLLNKYDIQGSPFHPQVRPAPVSAPHCTAEGTALYCGIAGGVINRIVIRCRNLFGEELRNVRGVQFQAAASAPLLFCDQDGNLVPAGTSPVWENEDGSYALYYVVDDDLVLQRLQRGESLEASISIELDDGTIPSKFEGEERKPRPIRGSPFCLVLAESATGQALANAAKHASMLLSGQQVEDLLSFAAEEPPSFLRLAAPSSGGGEATVDSRVQQQQQQPIAPSFIVEAEQQQERLAREAAASVRQQQQQEHVEERRGSQQDASRFAPPPQQQQRRASRDHEYYRPRASRDDTGYQSDASFAPPQPQYDYSRSYMDARGEAASYRREEDSYRNASRASNSLRPNDHLSFREEELLRERRLQQQREMELAQEREQLLKLRRDLQNGQNEMQDHLARLNLSAGLMDDNSSPPHPHPYPLPFAATRRSGGGGARPSQAAKQQFVSSAPPPAAPRSQPPTSLQQQHRDSAVSNNPFDAEITAMFNAKARELKRIFRHYSAYQDLGDAAGGRQQQQQKHLCTLSGFLACWMDFEICPTFISKREVQAVYKKRVESQGLDGMDFPLFVECLGLVAFAALEKPPLSSMYPTPAKRIGVLLGMWRLGDSTALDDIVKRHKYSSSRHHHSRA